MINGNQLFNELWTFYKQQMSSDKMSSLDFAQLVTYLLFLKIDDERSQRRINRTQVVPEGLGWQSLFRKDGSLLEEQYRHIIIECGKHDPDPKTLVMQAVFHRAASDPRCSPSALSRLMRDVIAQTQWSQQGNVVLGEMYALLMREASSGFQIASGQTLTPWPLVCMVIDCLRPSPSDVVIDPACGTGSFLVAARASAARTGPSDGELAEDGTVTGADFDPIMCRFATMNYLLSTGLPFDSPPPVRQLNSLAQPETSAPTIIVCNPPYRSTAPLPDGRTDLWARTGSMQLNFLQHIARGLPIGGRAAVFVPDNILFGSGAEATVRRRLLKEFDVHTLLRLPTGVFAQGSVRTNVLFFDAVRPLGDGTAVTRQVWVYDFRSGLHFAVRERPLELSNLEDFVTCFGYGRPRSARTETDTFKPVSYETLAVRDFNLDILWPPDTGANELRDPREIALEIRDELHDALEEIAALADELPGGPVEEDT